MRLGITGTPGTGKTTLTALLESAGFTVTSVQALADAHGAVAGHDDADDADVIDTDALAPHVPTDVVVDGHLSHLLPMDEVWVIRCDPRVLEQRLQARGYAPKKVQENLEAEAVDLVLQESLASGARVVQRDGTRRTPEELFAAFLSSQAEPLKNPDLEPVDWSDWLLR